MRRAAKALSVLSLHHTRGGGGVEGLVDFICYAALLLEGRAENDENSHAPPPTASGGFVFGVLFLGRVCCL